MNTELPVVRVPVPEQRLRRRRPTAGPRTARRSTPLDHIAIVEGWEKRRTLESARTTAAYTAKLQASQATTPRALCHTSLPGAPSAPWGGSVLGPTTASYCASSLGTSWRATRTLPTPRPSDSTRCRWVGPRIPTSGVTTVPNSTVVSWSWSLRRDRLRPRRRRIGVQPLSPRVRVIHDRKDSALAASDPWPGGGCCQRLNDRKSKSMTTAMTATTPTDKAHNTQPVGHNTEPRSMK
jgi:hypothetical protein